MSNTLDIRTYLLARGRMMHDLGRGADARLLLERLLALEDVADAIRAAAHRVLAELDIDAQQFRRARRHLRAVIILEPTDAASRYRFARAIDADPTADPQRGWKSLRKAIDLEPTKAEYWSLLGRIGLKIGRPRAALKAFRRAAELAPREESVLDEIAIGFWSLNRDNEAATLLTRARFRAPHDSAIDRLWDRFRFECSRRMQDAVQAESDDARPNVLAFTGRVSSDSDEGTPSSISRTDGGSVPQPHLFRLMGDPKRARQSPGM